MLLSEQLKEIHDSGDCGQALEGLSDISDNLEGYVFENEYHKVRSYGASHEDAVVHANNYVKELSK